MTVAAPYQAASPPAPLALDALARWVARCASRGESSATARRELMDGAPWLRQVMQGAYYYVNSLDLSSFLLEFRI